ncbi:MAG: aspartate kinase, partial [Winogradskyella arenosi]
MRIFKFGGASVKDANGVRNVAKVLKTTGYDNTLVVISAMGKTTNSMELVIKSYFETKGALPNAIHEVVKYHDSILKDLFTNDRHQVFTDVKALFEDLNLFFKTNKSPDYNFIYDQVIGYDELISTTIVSHYFNEIGIKNQWNDVREFIKTDNYYRHSNVNWEATQRNIATHLEPSVLNITQGFLGSDANNFTTTLGREGSDYTAAIFAYCLNASSVTIWKDVPGVLNADPRYFENAQLLNQ